MLRRLRHAEHGGALIVVIGITAILSIVAIVALNYVRNAQPQARQHQDWNAALAAADAGIDDYLTRLNRDLDYHEVDATSQDPLAPDYNAGLDPDAWAQLLDSDGEYTYTVDTSDLAESSTVRLTSTGRVNGVTRSVEATLRPRTFLDFIYLTNVEPGAAFTTEDDIRGPLHSNDTIVLAGQPRFWGPVTIASDPLWAEASWSTASPDFQAGDPVQVSTIPLPPSNAELSTQATQAAGGCLYYGPTYIRIQGDQMRVDSPRSQAGINGTAPACLGSTTLTWVPIPANGVIYVANAPSQGNGHPLGLSGPVDRDGSHSSTDPQRIGNWQQASRGHPHAGDAFIWGELDGRVTIGAQRDVNILWDLTYQDPDEDLLGLIANDHINVWHPASNSDNQPVTSAGSAIAPFPDSADMPPLRNGTGDYFTDPEIDAAMLALNGSFRIFNLFRGDPLGNINVNGAISQQRRHAVGVATNINYADATFDIRNGYGKDYSYDNRLQYLTPPYFINPVESQYQTVVYTEVQQPDGLPE